MAICIIPARSGSKRIKNKNIQKINGIPLIGMTIKIAKKSGLFKRIIVSTDCPKISSIAKKYGAEVPFLRDKKLSNDFTPTFKVLIDVVKKIGSQKEKFHFCIYPTSILISKNDLKMALLKIKKTKSKYIFPIAEFESNPYRSFIIKNNFIKFTWPKYQLKRSQDLDSLYYDTGSFYIYETKALLTISEKELIPKKSTYIILKKKLIDVNYPKDLKLLKEAFKNSYSY
jgi:pseudaminic acid cytidylyltransferase